MTNPETIEKVAEVIKVEAAKVVRGENADEYRMRLAKAIAATLTGDPS